MEVAVSWRPGHRDIDSVALRQLIASIPARAGNDVGGVYRGIAPARTIARSASIILSSAYASLTVYTNGSNWFTR
ncbi:hypothetical protein [Micromonospora musae]|uniref:hypothetical protein n=1 Tax=Micromonospora musae TaxID=1894970 RepID=UPI0033CFC369